MTRIVCNPFKQLNVGSEESKTSGLKYKAVRHSISIYGTCRNKAKIKNIFCTKLAFEGQRTAFSVAEGAWYVEEPEARFYKGIEKNP